MDFISCFFLGVLSEAGGGLLKRRKPTAEDVKHAEEGQKSNLSVFKPLSL